MVEDALREGLATRGLPQQGGCHLQGHRKGFRKVPRFGPFDSGGSVLPILYMVYDWYVLGSRF